MTIKRASLLAIAITVAIFRLHAIGPSFHPDTTFKGSALTNWHTLGEAGWRAQDGTISGTPKQPGGGWLVLDRSFQDVAFFASFRCSGGCKTGVLLRAEKTADGGMKGVFMSLNEGDLGPYAIVLDAQGKEVSRQPLRTGGGTVRIAPPPAPNAPARGGAAGGGRAGLPGRGGPGVTLPLTRPDTSFRSGDWNTAEIIFDVNIARLNLNDGSEIAGAADAEAGNYGPLALYVGGTGEVQFKDLAYKDTSIAQRQPDTVSSKFRMQKLNDFYYSWGAAAADFNHDGILDVVAGPYIFFGPDYTTRREIYPAKTVNPSDTYAGDAWMQYAADFTGDGWPDVIDCIFSNGQNAGTWLYVNPKGESRRWDKIHAVDQQQSEVAVLKDLDGDGKPELVYMGGGRVRYAKPDSSKPLGPWIVHDVSEQGYATAHGIGAGDVNGDGRIDIVNAFGWWEQPPTGSNTGTWAFHPAALARYGRNIVGGSVMAVYDVNGDGLNDIVTSLQAHGWGLAWFEQKRASDGNISFVEHMIMDDNTTKNTGGVTFSELHGSTVADIDGDGIPDFIVGKRYWAHLDDYYDPDPYGPAVLYVYRTVRNPKAPGGAEFVPELVHNWSGAGSDLLAVDLNKDGATDIVTSTKFGTFIFWGKPGAFRTAAK